MLSTNDLETKIKELAPTMHKISRASRGTLSEYDADDLYQHACMKLLEQIQTNAAVLIKPAPYFYRATKWKTRSLAAAGRRYTQFESEHLYRTTSYQNQDVEQVIIVRETINDLWNSLSPSDKTLVNMLYQGYTQQEISVAMGIGKSAISMRKARIARQLKRR